MGEMINVYNIFIEKLERKRPRGRAGRIWKGNIRMEL
jgi:hypothetical protein